MLANRQGPDILQTNMSLGRDIKSTWESLRATHTGLPPELRAPQIDALHYLAERKHVIMCVGTGTFIQCLILNSIFILISGVF